MTLPWLTGSSTLALFIGLACLSWGRWSRAYALSATASNLKWLLLAFAGLVIQALARHRR